MIYMATDDKVRKVAEQLGAILQLSDIDNYEQLAALEATRIAITTREVVTTISELEHTNNKPRISS